MCTSMYKCACILELFHLRGSGEVSSKPKHRFAEHDLRFVRERRQRFSQLPLCDCHEMGSKVSDTVIP